MSVLDFVFPVWSNTLQEFGIAISQKKYFITLRALFSPASSLQIKSAEDLPPLNEDEVYFLSIRKALDRCLDLPVLKSRDLLRPETLEAEALNSSSSLIAYNPLTRSYGICFLDTEGRFADEVCFTPFYDILDGNYMPPMPSNNEVLFLNMSSMIAPTKESKPFEVVNRAVLKYYRAAVFETAQTVVTKAVTTRFNTCAITPAPIPVQERQNQKNLLESEGLTTVATDKSYQETEPKEQPVFPENEMEVDNDHDDTYFEEQPEIHRHVPILEDIDSRIKNVDSLNSKITIYNRGMQPGASISGDLKSKWIGMRENLGWKIAWVNDSIGNPQDVFCTPYTEFSRKRKIMNVEYFYPEDFQVHYENNKWIAEEWWDVWPRLQKCGWVAVPYSTQGKNKSAYECKKVLKYLPNLTPGFHVFRSKLKLVQYIARFPYLLQNDKQLMETLKNFGFKPKQGKIFINNSYRDLDDAKTLFWAFPTLLFSNFISSKEEEQRLLLALGLTKELAEEEDHEAASPLVEGMSIEERDRLCRDLDFIGKKCLNWNSEEKEEYHNLLLKLGWEYTNADFTNKWWKWEKVYLPPYSNSEDMQFGRDFFFLLEDVAIYINADRERILGLPKNKLSYKDLRAFTNFDNNHHFTLEKRIQYLVMNEDIDAFTKFNVGQMLNDAGWVFFQEDIKKKKVNVYLPKLSVDTGINQQNYHRQRKGKDFLVGEEEVIAYFRKHYAEKSNGSPSSPGDTSMSSLSTHSARRGKTRASSHPSSPVSLDGKDNLRGQAIKAGITAWGNPALLPDLDYQIYHEIQKEKTEYSFGSLYAMLKKLGWDTAWVNYELSYVCTPRMLDLITAARKGKYVTQSIFVDYVEDVDYFRNDKEGHLRLYHYLRKNGLKHSQMNYNGSPPQLPSPIHPATKHAPLSAKKVVGPRKQIIAKSPEIVKGRSPMKPLYKAGDPALHYDRLASNLQFSTPLAEEEDEDDDEEEDSEDEEEIGVGRNMRSEFLGEDEEDEDESNGKDEEEDEDAEEFAPGYFPEENPLLRNPASKEVIDCLLAQPFNFNRLVKAVRSIGYTWDYGRGIDFQRYFLPGFSNSSENLVLNENYFNDPDKFVHHLRERLGLSAKKAIPAERSAEKARKTRSGKVINLKRKAEESDKEDTDDDDDEEQQENEEEEEPEQENHKNHTRMKRKRNNSHVPSENGGDEETEDHDHGSENSEIGTNKFKRLRLNDNRNKAIHRIKAGITLKSKNHPIPAPAMTNHRSTPQKDNHHQQKTRDLIPQSIIREGKNLSEAIQIAYESLQVTSGYSSESSYPIFPVPERAEECKLIYSIILKSIRTGKGNCLYLSGSCGMGKSVTVYSAVKNAKLYCHSHEIDFLEISLNGNALTDKGHLIDLMNSHLTHIKTNLNEYQLEHYQTIIHPNLESSSFEVNIPSNNEFSNNFSPSSQSGGGAGSQSTHSHHHHHPSHSHGKKRPSGPLLVLLVDELDRARTPVLQLLLRWSLNGSILLIGTGNRVNVFATCFEFENKPMEITFTQYSKEQLASIVSNKLKKLIGPSSTNFLLLKIMGQYKGDIRALFDKLKQILLAARDQLTIDELNGSIKEIITIPMIHTYFPAEKDTQLKSIAGLNPFSKNLLVSLFLSRKPEEEINERKFTGQEAVNAFRSTYEDFGQVEGPHVILSWLNTDLVVSNMVKVISQQKEDPLQWIYQLYVPIEVLLEAERLTPMERERLRRLVK